MSEITETPVEQVPATTIVDSSIPGKLITRNEFGLVNNGSVKYVYTPEGLIDWRAMINPKHIVVNKFNFEKKGKPVPESLTGLDDRDLLILLAGMKELAQVRGFRSVRYSISTPTPGYVVAACTITWIGNFETENREIEFTSIGDAHPENTNKFGRNFLAAIAENRAFVRSVRNFLKINILAQDEVDKENPLSSDSGTVDPALESMIQVMDAHGINFEKIKATLIKEQYPDAANLKTLSDIPPTKRFELVGRIKDKAKAKKEAKT